MGHAAIQLAKWAGAVVITTVSGPEKAALATGAGADHVINYRETHAAEEIRRIAPDGPLPVGEASGLPLHRFDLAGTAAAHTAVEESIVGKVLIDVAAG